jgi:thymidylate synthase
VRNYLDLLSHVLENGTESDDRTGVGTLRTFGNELRFDLTAGFPIVTTKQLHFKSAVHETLWFISGDTNVKYLQDNGVKIWNEWADESGELGPVYGAQWRNWGPCVKFEKPENAEQVKASLFHFDQLAYTINQLKTNPESRRHLVSAWNAGQLPQMKLPPCHLMYQFYVSEGKLSTFVFMRSVDCFLGLPFDIVDYALLTKMVAQVTDLVPNELIFYLGDTHVYKNHLEQVKLQLTREPKPLPKVMLSPGIDNIDDFTFGDIVLLEYEAHPRIPGKVAV